MCHSNPLRWAILFGLAASVVEAQTWRKLGASAVDTGLAGLAGGSVSQVWFSPEGDRLFAKTSGNAVFVTSDFENWTGVTDEFAPENRSTRITGPLDVIGGPANSSAVSPRDPDFLAVANQFGVWASHDRGISWVGLNEQLPNFPVRSLLAHNRIAIDGLGEAEYAGRSGWIATAAKHSNTASPLAGSGDVWYRGTPDGRIFASSDARAHWTAAALSASGPIEHFWVDPTNPRIAFASASSRGAHLFRTINGGITWFDITGSLSDTPARGITADHTDGAVYVATDRGVFLSRMDLNAVGAPSPWTDVSAGLPSTSIRDVSLEANGRQLKVAVDGWGVYVTRAPHQVAGFRLVNAADLANRAAAPGGLLSAIGISVESAMVAGRQFPILAKSQIQVPFDLAPSEIQIELNRSLRTGITVKAVSPSIFIDRDGAPLLLDPDTGMMLDGTQPIAAKSSVQLLATGLGRVTPDWPSGVPAPFANPPTVTAEIQAYLNGMPVEVTKATLAPGYVGMYLVEIKLPAILDAGIADFYLYAGSETSNHIRLAVTL